jgi:sterol 3beta-glucosyltransferase
VASSSLHVAIVAAGSRGDVQPHVALGAGLRDAGHEVRFLASADFRELIEDHGLEFFDIGGSMEAVAAQMQELLESGNFLRILSKMGDAAKTMSRAAAENGLAVCKGCDVVIAGLGGLFTAYAIAETLGIPFVPAFLYPFAPTREFPGVLTPVPQTPLTSWVNPISHRLGQQMIWQTTRSADNRARADVLGIARAPFFGPYRAMSQSVTLYGYSTAVIAEPIDWPASQHVTGYWFLDPHAEWTPPELTHFLDSGPAPVYVGFGSMGSKDPEASARLVLDALQRSGQRGVLSSGWGGLMHNALPESVFMVGSMPHAWLFPRMAAVVHHGGAGTTAAGLSAGVPSVVTPVMGDQPFWGRRVHELGAGPKPVMRRQLTAEHLADAIGQAVGDEKMREQAAVLGKRIRAEDGVGNAVRILENSFAKG